jgi:nucleoside-diphosphate-sugar epimerase
MDRIALVTGANGFVGSHLCDGLLEDGWRVRALVRRTSDLRWLDLERVERIYGDASSGEGLEGAVSGVDTVFHLAGITRAPDEETYDRVNVEGCARVARAAAASASPPRRLVLMSSLAAGGPIRRGGARSEADADEPTSAYGRSKLRGEVELIRHARGVPWTVVRPAAVCGPRDRGFLTLARLAKRGWVPRLSGPPQLISLVHVRDLVRGVVQAALSPRTAGRKYYLAHADSSTWEALGRELAVALGRSARVFWIPRGILPLVGFASGVRARSAGAPNRMPMDRLRDLQAPSWVCSSRLAREDFGFVAAVSPADGMREAASWYRENGWL